MRPLRSDWTDQNEIGAKGEDASLIHKASGRSVRE